MKPQPRFRTALALTIILFAVQASRGQSGSSQSELQMTLTAVPNDTSLPTFDVELTNSGNHDLILNLGMMLGNGRKQYPDAIHLSLRNDQNTETLNLRGPALVAGRIDAFIVPLPKGARIILPINLADYWTHNQRKLKPGRYFLSAEYRGEAAQFVNLDTQGIKAMPCWLGRASSAEISFTVPD